MGRYYQTATGREGKFWFAVQPSDDPQKIYGMDEVERDDDDEYDYGDTVDYYTDDKDYVRNKLEEQYTILGVPPDRRRYEVDIRAGYVWDELDDYFLTTQEPPRDQDGYRPAGYYMGEGKPTKYPISKGKELAASRVQLGLIIYNDIIESGSCSMTAEF